jgi:hypothetical protein
MSPLTARILEQKRQRRQALAALPFPEKVRIVEKLRETSLQIASVARQQGLRKRHPASVGGPIQAITEDDDILGEMLDDTRD